MQLLADTTRIIWFGTFLALGNFLHADSNWNQFRGNQGRGFIENKHHTSLKPLSMDNINWHIQVGRGHSSPVLTEDSIIITTFEGGDFYVRSFNKDNGRSSWNWKTHPNKIEKGHRNGSPAASSVAVSDSGDVIAYSGSFGLVCLDRHGNEKWRKDLPTPITQHGSGTSPIIADNKVILCVDQDLNSHLLCFDLNNGKKIWRAERNGFRRGFSTPLIWKDTNNIKSVFVLGTLRAVNYSLDTGSELWSVAGLPNETCSTPVFSKNKLYLAAWTYGVGVSRIPDFSELLQEGDNNNDGVLSKNEAPPGSPAKIHFPYVDADKDGVITNNEYDSLSDIFRNSKNTLMALDVSNGATKEPTILWKFYKGLPYVPSPIVYREKVYIVKNGGMVSAFDQHTGKVFFQQERLGAIGDYYASPIAVGNRILFISQQGILTELAASEQFEIRSQLDLKETVFATPAISHNSVIVRTSASLVSFNLE